MLLVGEEELHRDVNSLIRQTSTLAGEAVKTRFKRDSDGGLVGRLIRCDDEQFQMLRKTVRLIFNTPPL